jgi:hypothetical protein
MDFVTCGSCHFCCREILPIGFSENCVASSTFFARSAAVVGTVRALVLLPPAHFLK